MQTAMSKLDKSTNKKVHHTNLMSEIISNENLDKALEHVYKSRKNETHNSDIWSLSLYWENNKKAIRKELLSGKYLLTQLSVFKGGDGKYYSRFSSRDAVVLKAVAMILDSIIIEDVGDRCFHLKGHGGLKGAIREASSLIKDYTYVIKSDVADFYASTNHKILLDHCKAIIKDKRIISILYQYMNRLEVYNGEYNLIYEGISKGCPLSPLMGALILKSLDQIARKGCAYIRYMDDWIILTKTRWQCRRLVKKMHEVMHQLKYKLAKDKTFIGRIKKGFDFLGYHFNNEGIIGLATKTIRNFIEKTAKLY
jgi:RNA-directed DNA polymerase